MPRRWTDHLQPTAIGLVSRGWVIAEVDRHALDPVTRARCIDVLLAYTPPRRHGLRNNFVFWLGALGAAALAGALGAPPWTGFVVALLGFAALARLLAVRALRWRLAQELAGRTVDDGPP